MTIDRRLLSRDHPGEETNACKRLKDNEGLNSGSGKHPGDSGKSKFRVNGRGPSREQ